MSKNWCNDPKPADNNQLHSPPGKFKRTNMADDQVDLTYIPGVSFSKEEIEKLTLAQLKFWLKCPSINQNGSN